MSSLLCVAVCQNLSRVRKKVFLSGKVLFLPYKIHRAFVSVPLFEHFLMGLIVCAAVYKYKMVPKEHSKLADVHTNGTKIFFLELNTSVLVRKF